MPARNHTKGFRPLRPGIYIWNPATNGAGTIGALATSDGSDLWLISCFHVLGRADKSSLADGDAVFQPSPPNQVAVTSSQHGNATLDCAAAKCLNGILGTNEILEIGHVGSPLAPAAGMRVLKSGIETGITEGVVESVDQNFFIVRAPDTFPADYSVTEIGDSGALWVERDSRRAVGLNLGLAGVGQPFARAVSMMAVLDELKLKLVDSRPAFEQPSVLA